MPSKAKNTFDENKEDVDQLWVIHQEVAGQGPGRKHGVEVLNRAAIVFITACWESFVEDLAKEAFDFLMTNVPSALNVPSKVRDLATRQIFEQKDSRKVWDLADSGWRALLAAHKAATLDRWIGTLNTPKAAQVNSLFEELLGIPKLSAGWRWQNMTQAKAEHMLDNYISIRGDIAHRVAHNTTVYKNWGTQYLDHVTSLVAKSETIVAAHLVAVTGEQPW